MIRAIVAVAENIRNVVEDNNKKLKEAWTKQNKHHFPFEKMRNIYLCPGLFFVY